MNIYIYKGFLLEAEIPSDIITTTIILFIMNIKKIKLTDFITFVYFYFESHGNQKICLKYN